MAWNRSNEGPLGGSSLQRKNAQSGLHAGMRFPFVCGIAAVIVLAGATIGWWLLGTSKTDKSDRTDKRSSLIREAVPAGSTTSVVETASEKKEPEPQKVGEIRDGMIRLANGQLYPYKNVHTNRTAGLRPKYKIFHHHSENVIASLLCIEPGATLVGGLPNFHGRITADFLESLKEPILPEEGDSDEDKRLRKLVNQAKIELKAAYDRGEDIEEILAASRKELQKLAQYKQSIKEMALKGAKEATSEADVDTLFEAANKMLEDKGIAPLRETPFTRLKFKMISEENKQ